ncbi:hypothetical protein [Nonomuraea africana]|uniref:Type A2 lantipeptide n=1 Tax=Nonomuraea africana TaxID=46171 RepID=A0ABR9KP03_9ACTN|nr:hypothetical protein [Nonomuraea africana]MBE1563338.1 hypothetical protein [Nonomuraea africana]
MSDALGVVPVGDTSLDAGGETTGVVSVAETVADGVGANASSLGDGSGM